MEAIYPRSRDETGPLPDQREIVDLCERFWDLEVNNVCRANSQCVFFCDSLRDGRVVFRVNPGWDGSNHPRTIVEFVRHLADRGAPCPDIRPTTDGSPCKSVRDLVISVESFLEGKVVDRVDTLRSVGEALARVHDASEDFPIFSSEVKDARLYISDALEYCERTTFSPNAAEAVTRLRAQLNNTPNRMNVRWLFCRGDVRSWNTIASPSGEIRFTDFNSAHFAPALVDVVMVRMQWLIGTVGRQLSDEEMQGFVAGYFSVRPPSEDELTALPLIFSAWYARRLCQLHRKWSPKSPNRKTWELDDRILALPHAAIRMGEAAVEGID